MAKVFQINVSPGGVPTAQVVFGRAIKMPGGKKAFAGYLWAADNSHFHRFATKVDLSELRELGLAGVDLTDQGGKRVRKLIRIIHGREDPVHHNSQDKLVCLFALERLYELRNQGFPMFPGALGENLTTGGLTHSDLRVGSILHVGIENERGMALRMTSPREPCSTIEAFAKVANVVTNRPKGKMLRLARAIGFTEDPHKEKFGGSGWYAAIHDIWGSGIVMPLDQIKILE